MNRWMLNAMTVCDVIVAICFVIMPYALWRLFRARHIGYVLDGWYRLLSVALILCASYRVMAVAWHWYPQAVWEYVMADVASAVTVFVATVFLLYRSWHIDTHPEEVENSLHLALENFRVFIAERGNESGEAYKRGA